MPERGLIERYRGRLNLEPGDPIVSLQEGSTPLIPSPRLSERVGAGMHENGLVAHRSSPGRVRGNPRKLRRARR